MGAVVHQRQTQLNPLTSATMRAYIAAACLFTIASAAPQIGVQRPIAILRSNNEGPLPTFRYSFESENEIQQSAEGELRTVGDAEVMVMRGSYSYVGPDSNTYVVDWYADETGFHPSAPHLPQSVVPNHPEVAAAVEAQLRFAAEEEAAAAASSRSNSYAAPLPGYATV